MSESTDEQLFNIKEVSDEMAGLLSRVSYVTNMWVIQRKRAGKCTDGAFESLVIYCVAHVLCNTFPLEDILPAESVATLTRYLDEIELSTGPVPDPDPILKA